MTKPLRRFFRMIIALVIFPIFGVVFAQETNPPKPSVRPFSLGLELLTGTEGVNLEAYLGSVFKSIRSKALETMPPSVANGERGVLSIRFRIQRDGTLAAAPTLASGSGKKILDDHGMNAVSKTAPFEPLPEKLSTPSIELRLWFYYNVALPWLAQTSSHAEDARTASLAQVNQLPFDELELFAFCAGAPMDSYVRTVVQQRGTNFTPDSTFIASFPTTSFQSVLKTIQARNSETLPQSQKQAYQLLRQAWDAQRNGRYATADQSYRKALQLAPNSATLHSAYAHSLLFSKDYPQAEVEARQSLQLWPENADAHAMLALSLTAQKQFVDAEAESREALRIFPEQHSAMLALAVSLTHLHKFSEAIPFLQKIMPVLPNVLELRKLMGVSLIENGEVGGGMDQLNSYVKAVPEDAEGHYYLGVGLRMKGSSIEAHAQFAEAFRLQPNNAQYEAATRSAEN